eukprot:CAMPEP_0119343292 /NCGR_PEP_ID=MMETSP1333-20130426/106367_1 /TAXON_ID=418940 /ORGANISM="Scyphosphaera apsteinii, Strain RCC1455" /LENGTH=385 /DNA_ID=CAMNT_0007355673 /DNA_START=249 /DNA_END=1407 /DNA_ORIENTATION=-
MCQQEVEMRSTVPSAMQPRLRGPLTIPSTALTIPTTAFTISAAALTISAAAVSAAAALTISAAAAAPAALTISAAAPAALTISAAALTISAAALTISAAAELASSIKKAKCSGIDILNGRRTCRNVRPHECYTLAEEDFGDVTMGGAKKLLFASVFDKADLRMRTSFTEENAYTVTSCCCKQEFGLLPSPSPSPLPSPNGYFDDFDDLFDENKLYVVTWHVLDHAEGEVYQDFSKASSKFDELDGGKYPARMYDADLKTLRQYGSYMSKHDWDMLHAWAKAHLSDEDEEKEKSYSFVTSGSCESKNLATITSKEMCSEGAAYLGLKISWGPHGGYDDVVDGCSVRFKMHLFLNPQGTCEDKGDHGWWTYTGCKGTSWMPLICVDK